MNYLGNGCYAHQEHDHVRVVWFQTWNKCRHFRSTNMRTAKVLAWLLGGRMVYPDWSNEGAKLLEVVHPGQRRRTLPMLTPKQPLPGA